MHHTGHQRSKFTLDARNPEPSGSSIINILFINNLNSIYRATVLPYLADGGHAIATEFGSDDSPEAQYNALSAGFAA